MTKADFLVAVREWSDAVRMSKSCAGFWSQQYDMYASGERGVLIHDTTLSLCCDETIFDEPAEDINTIINRR